MKFNVLLTGVGGEGVLLASAILARAANIEGYEVHGIQLHGLAQRGGSIPTYVRFGDKGGIYSPIIPRGGADLIIGLETIEAARSCYFADKKKTNFLIDTYTVVPVYANLSGVKYPSEKEVEKMIAPFAKSITIVDASRLTKEKLGSALYGNAMAFGVAIGKGLLPLKRKSLENAMAETIPRDMEKNLQAFKMGLEFRG
ncbi:Indolepyruvate oxidoreductase subunit IorB [Candidatus Gugararchaeum adminiculabundum]|nr:Indolepyruvate oxidoreductase subunit IorB [Candidatus Gugararchaeum adminiculabundum]